MGQECMSRILLNASCKIPTWILSSQKTSQTRDSVSLCRSIQVAGGTAKLLKRRRQARVE